jgi:hypothetical protein
MDPIHLVFFSRFIISAAVLLIIIPKKKSEKPRIIIIRGHNISDAMAGLANLERVDA